MKMQSPNRFSDFLRSFRGARPVQTCRTGKRQRGQALTEVVVTSLFVFIPTFAIGWALYAYGQARTTALNGARYAAWERTVWRESGSGSAVRSTGEIENLMVERFFAKPHTAIKSIYTSGTEATNADTRSFYSVHNGDKVISIESGAGDGDWEATRPRLTLERDGARTSTVAGLYNEIGGNLEERGIYVADVRLRLNNIRNLAAFDSLNLEIRQRAAVITDSWSAGGKAHEEAVVKPLVPFSVLQGLADLINLPIIEDLLPFREFKPGCIRSDVVPKKALPSGQSQTGGKC
jgi:hypothetical protein